MYGNLSYTYKDIASIDQLKVWQKILGKYVFLGEKICNPCRADKNPNCYLREYNGVILLTDFARPEYNKYTCLHAIADINHCDLNKAATIAINNFDVILPSFKSIEEKVTKEIKKAEITFEEKKWSTEDIIYWKKLRGIDIEELEQDGVFSVKRFTINKRLYEADSFCYAYTFPSGNIKLYQPYRKSDKWISNTGVDDVWSLGKETDVCVITKAYKDAKEINTLTGLKTYAFMNEAVIPNSISFNNYSKSFILYDNDDTGKRGAGKLSTEIQNSYIRFVPETLGKDIDNVVVNQGLEYSKQLLNRLLT